MIDSLIYSIVPIISMIIGIYIGYKLRGDGGEDRLPDIKTPTQMIKEHKSEKETEKILKETEAWLKEIDNYNGEFGK